METWRMLAGRRLLIKKRRMPKWAGEDLPDRLDGRNNRGAQNTWLEQ